MALLYHSSLRANYGRQQMNRYGTVAEINPQRGMVAISTEDDGFTIVELLGEWDIDVGDSIAWENGYGLGTEIYQNLTRRNQGQVYVQNHSVGPAILRQQLLL